MKHTILFTTLFMCLVSFGFAQNLNPKEYNGIPESSKKRVFYEDFVDNRFHWEKPNSPNSHIIKEGYLFFTNNTEFPWADGKPISFDGSKNWEIECKLKFVSGNVELVHNIFFGELVFGDKYTFGFSSMGKFTIGKDIGLEHEDFVELQKSDLVNQTAENKFVIRKYGSDYYFFLNDKLVYEMSYSGLPGQYIGIEVNKKSLLQINYLRLQYLD